MSEKINDGGPAFPGLAGTDGCGDSILCNTEHGLAMINLNPGMTLREFAAIELRVADSGLVWLDEMILKSNRNRFAGMALCGICASTENAAAPKMSIIADWSYQQADAMLAQREKGKS